MATYGVQNELVRFAPSQETSPVRCNFEGIFDLNSLPITFENTPSILLQKYWNEGCAFVARQSSVDTDPTRIQCEIADTAEELNWENQSFVISPDGKGFSFKIGNLCDATYGSKTNTLRLRFQAPEMDYPNNTHLDKSAVEALRFFAVTRAALTQKGLSIHSALGVRDGVGILFPGASGKGKSTLSQDFVTVYGQADDVAIIRHEEGEQSLTVGPCITRKKTWANVSQIQNAKLKAIVFLEQSSAQTVIERIGPQSALNRIISEVIEYSKEPVVISKMLKFLDEMITQTPCFVLHRSLHDKTADEIFNEVLQRVK